jgi:hypothetical protein
MTECSQLSFDFQPLQSREVVGRFDGGSITPAAGALLLREKEVFAAVFQRLQALPLRC